MEALSKKHLMCWQGHNITLTEQNSGMSFLPQIYTVLVNYKGWEDTIECLESLLKLDYPHNKIMVVDNASPDNSFQHLINWADSYFKNEPSAFAVLTRKQVLEVDTVALEATTKLFFYQSDQNAGFAAGNNIGIRFALQQNSADFLWLLNNDTVVDKNCLSELVKEALSVESKKKKVGIWGSKILYYHAPDTIQALGGKLSLRTFTSSHIAEGLKEAEIPERIQAPDYIVGASMFVSKTFIEQVGLLDESYFLYFEELDWAERGRRKGFTLGFARQSKVFHKEGRSIGSSSSGKKKSELADYHGIRSKIIFFKKFYPERRLQLFSLLMASVILRLTRFQFSRAMTTLRLMLTTR
ncbi:glycosyltransferase family 2 protein [Rufibacter quisquiliarum]|uniref:Glycosyltransferase 2-like domain-containing protein n=1 Tax=Rufibacter quisquiliarum TaxID=1549639 RepID=A0A839GTW9_9BACT|nr:glycosyltransferase family 2 protein [Rufibacter quisquiliarum]MBA9077848.1 hypothetical protein [Rufibacter quisquiliarum]